MKPMELVEEIKRAVEYTKQKEYKKAEKIYLELLKEYPDNNTVLSFLGLLYLNQNKFKKAEKYLEKSYKICESIMIITYLGLCKYYLTSYKAAIPYLEKAVSETKTYEVYNALIKSLSKNRDYKKAVEYAYEAHKLFPANEVFLCSIAYNSLLSGQFRECDEAVKKILFINPKSTAAWHVKGILQEVLYSNEKGARECYRKMVRYGSKADGYMNLAISYSKDTSTRKKMYYCLQKAKLINPKMHGLNFLYASYYLSQRQFKKGYKYYVRRDMNSQDDINWFKRFKRPWKGGSYNSETLLIYGDQGLGDQIQFFRYLPFIAKKFKNLKVVVATSLIDLFKRSYKNNKNIKFYKRENKRLPSYDKSAFMAALIYYLNKGFKNIPYSAGYLISDYKKIEEYKTKYFNTDNLKIGICWEAGAAAIHDQIHRILNVELFEDIINMPDAKVYSFQVKPSLENYKKYPNLIDLGSTFKDFDDTAAALKNLDVLVTVDTSVAHLAGALGVKTFMILPYCPDWRWFDNDKTTEWYESITIFKQKINEDWDIVFERIVKQLSQSIDPLNKL